MRKLFLAVGLLAAATPGWAAAGDREVAQQIADRLRDSGQLQDYRIEVKFNGGTAWLSGRVTSDDQLTSALQIANGSPEVDRVVSKVEVASSEPPHMASTAGHFEDDSPADDAVQRADLYEPEMPRPSRSPSMNRASGRSRPAAPRQASASRGRRGRPLPHGAVAPANYPARMNQEEVRPYEAGAGRPMPSFVQPVGSDVAPARYDHPHMPGYAWPSYAPYPNYAALTYPRQYSPTAWPYIGPFYPYPQVPLGWRKVTLEWDDGWWFLDFSDCPY
ncbi:MAG: BON domain-containing protein [Pirellulales bacterium]|nr:BON domain-containing protein [Pirellulales bacterium]